MFLIPSDDTIKECIVTKESVEGTGTPRLIHKAARKKLKRSASSAAAGEADAQEAE
jgi:ATP-dependent Clp protease ATP-binding subunit ClpX